MILVQFRFHARTASYSVASTRFGTLRNCTKLLYSNLKRRPISITKIIYESKQFVVVWYISERNLRETDFLYVTQKNTKRIRVNRVEINGAGRVIRFEIN